MCRRFHRSGGYSALRSRSTELTWFAAESPNRRKPKDVRVYRERWNAESLRNHHRCGFVADARKGFERRQLAGNLAIVVANQDVRHALQVLRLGRREPTGADESEDLSDGQRRQRGGGGGAVKQVRSHLVDALVRALGIG